MNGFVKFFRSVTFKLLLLFLVSVAGFVACIMFNLLHIYFSVTILISFITIFFLANRRERDQYKVIVFLTMLLFPILAIGYAVLCKDKKGNKAIKKEWSDIIYRNRKSIFSSNETMNALKKSSIEVYKTCNYLVDSTGLPCFQNAKFKYIKDGESYYKELFEECKKAKNFILFECYKITNSKLWWQFFDILRIKAREGVKVRVMYDDAISTEFISRQDFLRMRNHGIETVPFNSLKAISGSFINCRNYKRLCVIDGKCGFFGGFNVTDNYTPTPEFMEVTKDCGVKIEGDAVKNLTIMFFEDYQFATKKVINLQEYFADSERGSTKDWILPYSTNPVSQEDTNKNIILSLINNAKDNIAITTSYIALNDELKNALVVNAKSGVKVRLVFCSEKIKKSVRNLARSYFYDLLKEGIEVYEYRGGKMSTRLILIDNETALMSTNNLDCQNTYRHFNAGVFMYGQSVSQINNDMNSIIANSQLVTIKDLQKRKLRDKINATWSKFIALFR